jgi:outer membrane protein assembly factor BamB
MTSWQARVAAVTAGITVALSGCAAAGSGYPALDAAHGRISPQPPTADGSCGPPPRHAWAVDVTDRGRVRWQTSLTRRPDDAGQSVPAVVVGSVSVFAQDGIVHGLSLATGRQLWSWAGGQTVDGMWRWQHLLVVLTDQVSGQARLTGLIAATGAVRWVIRMPRYGLLGSQSATSDGGLAIVRSDGVVQVVSMSEGRVRWSRHLGRSAALATAGRLVLYVTGSRLQAFNDRTGRFGWALPGMPPDPQLQVVGGLTLVISGEQGPGIPTTLTAIRAPAGRIAWRFDPGMPVTVLSAGPAGLAVATYVPDRRLYLLDTRTGRVRWRVTTAVAPNTAPLVTQSRVVSAVGGVVGFTAQRLVSLDAASGRIAWAHRLTGVPQGPVLGVAGDAVVQTDPSGAGQAAPLLAYRLAGGRTAWRAVMPAFVGLPPVQAGSGLLLQPADLPPACPLTGLGHRMSGQPIHVLLPASGHRDSDAVGQPCAVSSGSDPATVAQSSANVKVTSTCSPASTSGSQYLASSHMSGNGSASSAHQAGAISSDSAGSPW